MLLTCPGRRELTLGRAWGVGGVTMSGRINLFKLEDSGFSVLSDSVDFSVDSDGELTLSEMAWAEKPRAV